MIDNICPFTWIFWNYVEGSNLRDYVNAHPQQLNLPFVHRVAIVLLDIFYACRIQGIQHGDLHEGNILISKPDIRFRDNKETIWVADFGLGSTRGGVKPKDDREEICKIIIGLLNEIHFEPLNAEHRILLHQMKVFVQKKLFDYDPTQVNFGNLAEIVAEFAELPNLARKEIEAKHQGKTLADPGRFSLGQKQWEMTEEAVRFICTSNSWSTRTITAIYYYSYWSTGLWKNHGIPQAHSLYG